MRIAITGANSATGRAILRRLGSEPWRSLEVVAAVRSERAARELPPLPPERSRIARISFDEREGLCSVLRGASVLVHLPGILLERRDSSYERAHVHATEVAVTAACEAGIRKLVLVSAEGADPASRNRYFKTKGQAEQVVRSSGLAHVILRAPLLIGPFTQEAQILRRAVAKRRAWLVGSGVTLQTPLDVDDLAEATLRAASDSARVAGKAIDLGGPERVTTRELFRRAGRIAGREVRIRSVSPALLRRLLALRTRLFGPGPSPELLEVLLSDSQADPEALAREFEVRSTPLDAALVKSLQPEEAP
jgi:NADH dehydrogenase